MGKQKSKALGFLKDADKFLQKNFPAIWSREAYYGKKKTHRRKK